MLGIYISFQAVVLAALRQRLKGWRPAGDWNLGKWGMAVDVVALCYGVFAMILLLKPPLNSEAFMDKWVVAIGLGIVVVTGLLYMAVARPYQNSDEVGEDDAIEVAEKLRRCGPSSDLWNVSRTERLVPVEALNSSETTCACVEMSPGQREVLESSARSQSSAHREVVRAKALIMAADGVATTAIAASLSVSPGSVKSWRDRFAEEGLVKLGQVRKGRGRKPSIPQSKIDEIIDLTQNYRPQGENPLELPDDGCCGGGVEVDGGTGVARARPQTASG